MAPIATACRQGETTPNKTLEYIAILDESTKAAEIAILDALTKATPMLMI